jgi:hypothetical protein
MMKRLLAGLVLASFAVAAMLAGLFWAPRLFRPRASPPPLAIPAGGPSAGADAQVPADGATTAPAPVQGDDRGPAEGLDKRLVIAGIIRTASGEALAGATVRIFGPMADGEEPAKGEAKFEPAAEATSDSSGAFGIAAPAAGLYTLSAGAGGFGRARLERVPSGATGLIVALRAEIAVFGRISAEEDRPVPGAQVRLLHLAEDTLEFSAAFRNGDAARASRPETEFEGRADAEGRFRLGGLPEGLFRYEVLDDAHRRHIEPLLVLLSGASEEERDLSVQLEGGEAIEGRVIEEGDAPVAGVRVQLRRVEGDPAKGRKPRDSLPWASSPQYLGKDLARSLDHFQTLSGEGGVFAVKGLAPGRYRVLVLHPEFAPTEIGPFAIEEIGGRYSAITGQRAVLEDGARLRGRLVGALAAGAVLTLRAGAQTKEARAGPDGAFEFRGLAAGVHELQALPPPARARVAARTDEPSLFPQRFRVEVEAGDRTIEQEFRLSE